jgi:uncharacterized protein YndB with AHSA1/START domain
MPCPEGALVLHLFSHSTAEEVFAALTDPVVWGLCAPILGINPTETRPIVPGSIWRFKSDEFHCDACEPPKHLHLHTKNLQIHYEIQELAQGTTCQVRLDPAGASGGPFLFYAKRMLRLLEAMERLLKTKAGKILPRVNLTIEADAPTITVTTRVEIHCPPEIVFDRLTSPRSWHEWQPTGPTANDTIRLSGSWPEVNSSFREESKSWIQWTIPWSKKVVRVLAYHPNQRLHLEAWEGSHAQIQIENEVVPSQNGTIWIARHRATCHLRIARRFVFQGICCGFPWDIAREAASLTAVCEQPLTVFSSQ